MNFSMRSKSRNFSSFTSKTARLLRNFKFEVNLFSYSAANTLSITVNKGVCLIKGINLEI